MIHSIKKVEYLDGFKLALTFNDNKKKAVDLKKYSKESQETVFYPFRNLDFFKSVKVDKHTGTIVWPNGVDLCPDVLYKIGTVLKEDVKKSHQKRKTTPSSSSKKTKTSNTAKSKH